MLKKENGYDFFEEPPYSRQRTRDANHVYEVYFLLRSYTAVFFSLPLFVRDTIARTIIFSYSHSTKIVARYFYSTNY